MGTTYQQTEVITEAPKKKDHSLAYGAGGAVAGLAAGALLMHEGHKVGMFSSDAPFQWIITDGFCLRQRSTGKKIRRSSKKISKVAVTIVKRSAASTMTIDMVAINTTRRQLLYAKTTMDTVEKNTETSTETTILSKGLLDGLGTR